MTQRSNVLRSGNSGYRSSRRAGVGQEEAGISVCHA